MTPRELRERARSHLEEAELLFAQGKYDSASEKVGYTAEMALKARYCTRQGLADFPNNRKEAKARGIPDVITHELDDLLKLSQQESIKTSSLQAIDWARVTDWSPERRYCPLGTITRERAETQIAETKKLFLELTHYEFVERLVGVEQQLADAHGPFNLFMYEEVPGTGWRVLASAWWLLADSEAKMREFEARINAAIDPDLASLAEDIRFTHPLAELVQATCSVFELQHGIFKVKGNCVNGVEQPTGFLISAQRIPASDPALERTGFPSPPVQGATAPLPSA